MSKYLLSYDEADVEAGLLNVTPDGVLKGAGGSGGVGGNVYAYIYVELDGSYRLSTLPERLALTEGEFIPDIALEMGMSIVFSDGTDTHGRNGVTSVMIACGSTGDGTIILTFWDAHNNESIRLVYDMDTGEIADYVLEPM